MCIMIQQNTILTLHNIKHNVVPCKMNTADDPKSRSSNPQRVIECA